MNSCICTLFEGNYHYGIAALVNSLHNNGFNGSVYAGYRGSLPQWASAAIDNNELGWDGTKTLILPTGLHLHFIPLLTEYHFTNYKPDFMLELLEGPAKAYKYIFYFDPDIVVTAEWNCFEKWVNCGIALCEDVNSPLAENHPRRAAWRKFYKEKGLILTFKEAIYANGGFIGLTSENTDFLKLWKRMQEDMAPQIGGLSLSSIYGPQIPDVEKGPFSPFGKTDQDALNATVEAWSGDISFVGKEGMGFRPGVSIMPHALGHPKPWNWRPISQVLMGRPPRTVDREYWKVANGLITSQSESTISTRKIGLLVAAFLGRFYRRN